MMRGALATTSSGKRMLLSEPSRTPSAQLVVERRAVDAEQPADADAA